MLIFLCISYSLRLTGINAYTGIINATFLSKRKITGQLNSNPIFTNVPRFDQISFSLHKMQFYEIAFSVYRGFAHKLSISNCIFSNSISPIHISTSESGKLKPINSKIEYKNQDISLRDTIFDFCSSLSENGGSVYAEMCKISFIGVEFVHSMAQNGGAAYLIQGKVNLEGCSFYKCSSKINGGAMIAKECKLSAKKTFFVQNSAGSCSGAFSHSTGISNMIDCYIYENKATKGYGGISLEDIAGEYIKVKFNDNQSPVSEGGNSLNIISTADDFFVEECVFNGGISYISYPNDAIIHVTDSCFDVNIDKSHTMNGDPLPNSVDPFKKPYWGNNYYFGQCSPAPKLPPKYYKELFHYTKTAPVIEWWKLYIILAMFVCLVLFLYFIIPAVFFPLIADGAKIRGESKNIKI
ncbi:hypothetical protein TRFO_02361 [Tritrichomonas foetus]|uniref:Right handed beta helix domain-containing protein n=1 Tax=Tritrichomonas foetus TaxID=1144522 RepID=A0A1J4J6M9_9EUKA|nr:hypothetical protein TRFO_02361 [Tritrichomonas foetus]|eukprot:OHS93839.1 hypothetical protein TRFO_02361 [Tritrichomonas foetus]